MNASTNTTVKQLSKSSRSQVTFQAQMASLAVLGVIIVFGNLASIITFVKTQSLRRRSHYLIINLSAADLLIGIVDFMFFYYLMTGAGINMFAIVLDVIDTLTGQASILTLSAISLERFYAILFPFRHRMLRFRTYVALVVSPWLVAVVLAVLSVMSLLYDRRYYNVYINACFVVTAISLLLISVSYISMGCKIRRNSNPGARNQNRELRDKKLIVTLLIVTLSSLVTWLPLQGFIFVRMLCKTCPLPDSNDVFVMKFLQYCNSGLNIFIYMVRMPEFRTAFLALFCRRKERIMRGQNIEMQNTNKPFTSGEDVRVVQSGKINEDNIIQDTSNVHSFSQAMNDIDEKSPEHQGNINKLNSVHGNSSMVITSEAMDTIQSKLPGGNEKRSKKYLQIEETETQKQQQQKQQQQQQQQQQQKAQQQKEEEKEGELEEKDVEDEEDNQEEEWQQQK